ncbi:MAG: MFS transporter [Candidatus Daviesbacteria bacterium]|nr:MFS transporter [Candidatus Daviesbacteria bacterium]
MTSKPSFTSVISSRGFRFLWFNQILVQLSYNTINFALLIWVFKLTNSTLAVSVLMLAVYLPSLLFGMLAGIYVDRADRRKILLVIDLLLAVGFLLFIFIRHSYPLILIDAFFINTLGQFFLPTESSSIPILVKKPQLLLANSLFSLTLYGSFMIGYSLAGPILNYQGINAVFLFGFFAMIAATIISLNLPKIRSAQGGKFATLPDARELHKLINLTFAEAEIAAKFIRGKVNILAGIMLMAGMQGVIGALAVVMPSYMETVLHIHATDASYVLMIPLGLGMITGALLIGHFANAIPRRHIVIPAIIAAGILFLLAGITPFIADWIQAADLPNYIRHPRFFFRAPSLSATFAVGSYFLGIAAVGIIVPAQTVLQENTTEANRGKIFAMLLVMMNIFAAIVSLLAGLLADLFGPMSVLLVISALILPVGILVRRPASFLKEDHLPYRIREFLGLGHWEGNSRK